MKTTLDDIRMEMASERQQIPDMSDDIVGLSKINPSILQI
jgi:hypothetical protein